MHHSITPNTTALTLAAWAFLGVCVTAVTSYVISWRAGSISGGRLLGDLQILEKARALELDEELMNKIMARVRYSVEKHTGHVSQASG